MNLETLSREELIALVEDVLSRSKRTRDDQKGSLNAQLVLELRDYQIELEMQNRELRGARHELEQSRDRSLELYDFAPVAHFTLDEQLIIEELNLRAAALLAQPRDRIVGRSFLRLACAEDRDSLVQLIARARATSMGAVGELVLTIAGERRRVQAMVSAHLDLRSQSQQVHCALIDVTDRVRAESERDRAYASERALHQRFEVLDRINVSLSNILATQERTSAEAVLEALAEHSLALLSAQRASIALHGEVPLFVTRERNGEAPRGELVELTVPLRLAGRSLGQLTVAYVETGVDSRLDVQRTLELAAERAALALEIARMNRAEADERARLTLLDRAAGELAGCTDLMTTETALSGLLSELVPEFASACALFVRDGDGHRLLGAIHPEPTAHELLVRAAPELAELSRLLKQTNRAVIRACTELGPEETLLARLGLDVVSVVPLIARQQTLGFLALGYTRYANRDALRAREAVEQFAERCASAIDTARLLEQLRTAVDSRDTLLAIVSHDLRSPLNAILLTARSLASVPPQRERRRSGAQVDLIQRSVARMGSLIEDLLTASSIDAGQLRIDPGALSPGELLREACMLNEPSAIANKQTIAVSVSHDLPEVWADKSRILQVLTNLLGNAIKFSPPDSVLRLLAEPLSEGIRFGVVDRGPGIPPQQLQQVFERYWTGKRRRGGLGLGLFISQRIVLAHGGRIWVESAVGNGAAFYFTLPLATAEARTAPSALAAAAAALPARAQSN